MATNKVKPKIKPINPMEVVYHQYEYEVGYFGLFDDAGDGTPVVVGSKNLVEATIVNILKQPKPITIFYYKIHKDGYWFEYKNFRRHSKYNKGENP
jgi:hypothetical protein